eukprot:766782-Hanusia_phi.AAC.1
MPPMGSTVSTSPPNGMMISSSAPPPEPRPELRPPLPACCSAHTSPPPATNLLARHGRRGAIRINTRRVWTAACDVRQARQIHSRVPLSAPLRSMTGVRLAGSLQLVRYRASKHFI